MQPANGARRLSRSKESISGQAVQTSGKRKRRSEARELRRGQSEGEGEATETEGGTTEAAPGAAAKAAPRGEANGRRAGKVPRKDEGGGGGAA